MKRGYIQRKPPLTDAQKQIKEAYRQAKVEIKQYVKGKSTSGAKSCQWKGVKFKSEWERDVYKELYYKQQAKLIRDLDTHVIVTFPLYNEAGEVKKEQIEVDFTYFDIELNRSVRLDAKQPKFAVNKRTLKRTNLDAKRKDWFLRWEWLQFSQPDHMYVILRKHSTWRGIDI
jgi:hypothetical protein